MVVGVYEVEQLLLIKEYTTKEPFRTYSHLIEKGKER